MSEKIEYLQQIEDNKIKQFVCTSENARNQSHFNYQKSKNQEFDAHY